jgi:hypothetical protein
MHTVERIQERILDLVASSPDRRIRPIDLERRVVEEGESSKQAVKLALDELVRAKRLVYTYRDPCSFLEIPVVESRPES